ncbi:hypothetical protein HHI36_015083 [Cryptolaemus montrouzieri]|uniref:Uncharacterized protein n=1 Tax=Cryptolaemus montrouzieri TaxID=559131 RepID=A0ABD2N4W1_9CUCU
MMSSKHEEIVPQAGKTDSSESQPQSEHSGCPSDSGEGNPTLSILDINQEEKGRINRTPPMESTLVRSNSLGDFPLETPESLNTNLERSLKKRKLEHMLLKLGLTAVNKNEQDIRDLIGKVCSASLLVEQKIGLSICEVGSERKYEKLEQDIADIEIPGNRRIRRNRRKKGD